MYILIHYNARVADPNVYVLVWCERKHTLCKDFLFAYINPINFKLMKREKQEKMTYETPQLEVFEVEVEKGFAVSTPDLDDTVWP